MHRRQAAPSFIGAPVSKRFLVIRVARHRDAPLGPPLCSSTHHAGTPAMLKYDDWVFQVK
jgi:hypothetical protein